MIIKTKLLFFSLCFFVAISSLNFQNYLYASDNLISSSNVPTAILKNEIVDLSIEAEKITGIFKKVVQLVGSSVVKIKIKDEYEIEEINSTKSAVDELKNKNDHIEPQNIKDFNLYKTFKLPDKNVGSGFIIDRNGFIVTNYHVIKLFEEKHIEVTTFENKKRIAQVVGFDPYTDLAVIKIDHENLQPVTFEKESKAETGDWVVTIGNPYGHGQTISTGTISFIGSKYNNKIPEILTYNDFMQIDATINPGCSGGPLVNLRGEVIGINAAIATRRGGFQGIGFAIPAFIIKSVIKRLIDNHIDENNKKLVINWFN